MGRTVVNRVSRPKTRKPSDYLVVAGAAAIVLFALVGVVSAGAFIADKISSGSSTPTPKKTVSSTSNGNSAAIQDLARAQAQATAIVSTARQTSRAIVADATKRAHGRAAAIIAAANRRPARVRIVVATPAPVAANVVPAAPAPAAPVTAPNSGVAAGSVVNQGFVGSRSTGSTTGTTPSFAPAPAAPGAAVPNLGQVPATWLVVGYNATFGSGPGSAGSISVINRSGKTFSGVAEVSYGKGGTAMAPFANLAPGQTRVLALNGPAYRGGGYHIVMNVR